METRLKVFMKFADAWYSEDQPEDSSVVLSISDVPFMDAIGGKCGISVEVRMTLNDLDELAETVAEAKSRLKIQGVKP